MELTQSSIAEPQFIPDSKQLVILKETVGPQLKGQGVQSGHLDLAFDLLKATLYRMYGAVSIEELVKRSKQLSEAEKCSSIMRACIKEVEWAASTARVAFSTLKKILRFTSIAPNFLSRVSIRRVEAGYKAELGKQYGSLPEDDPARQELEQWVVLIRRHSRNKSVLSVRNIIRFYLNQCVPKLALDLANMPLDRSAYVTMRIDGGVVRSICGTTQVKKKRGWLQLFLTHIMQYKPLLSDTWFEYVDVKTKVSYTMDDGSDKHRIPVADLEKLYRATDKSVLDRLIYLLFLTTGMRIGGLSKIKTEHVAHVSAGDVHILDTGRTLEKGNKWFTFIIAVPVKELLFKWLTCHRPAVDSPYLFPGRQGHISTCNIRYKFKAMAKRAGITGPHMHPHALRHTYAHMMLETGNSVDTVAKLLGHASSKTTESFYLKENAVEVAKRANIPWLDKSQTPDEPTIPNFLQLGGGDEAKTQQRQEARKRRRKRKAMATLSMFSESCERGDSGRDTRRRVTINAPGDSI